METKDIIEALTYKIPDIRRPLQSLNIINDKRPISPTDRPEFDNSLIDFKRPKIICSIGILQTVFIVEPNLVNRRFPTIIISGKTSRITSISRSGLYERISQYMNISDFIPLPFSRKIILIDEYKDENIGMVISEHIRNNWTKEDPRSLPIENSFKSGCKGVIKTVVDAAVL